MSILLTAQPISTDKSDSCDDNGIIVAVLATVVVVLIIIIVIWTIIILVLCRKLKKSIRLDPSCSQSHSSYSYLARYTVC